MIFIAITALIGLLKANCSEYWFNAIIAVAINQFTLTYGKNVLDPLVNDGPMYWLTALVLMWLAWALPYKMLREGYKEARELKEAKQSA